jgi:hypothetical protein
MKLPSCMLIFFTAGVLGVCSAASESISSRHLMLYHEKQDTLTIEDSVGALQGHRRMAETLFRINCGGNAFIDANNNSWVADQNFVLGQVYPEPNTGYGAAFSASCESKEGLDAMHCSERYGNTFNYMFDVVEGYTYNFALHFAEIYHG